MEDLRNIKAVQDYLLNVDVYDDLEKIAPKYNIPIERVDEFLALTDAVVDGQLELSTMPAMLATAFGLDPKSSQNLAADLAGYVLLPLENYLPGLGKQILDWGGKTENYPTKRVAKEKASPDMMIVELAKRMGIKLSESLMARFVYLAKGYLTKTRAKDATKKILMRSIRIGGLDFTEEMAENFFKKMDEESKNFDLAEPEEVHPEVAEAFAGSKKDAAEHPEEAMPPKEIEQTRMGKPDKAKVVTTPGPRIKKKILTKAELLEKVKALKLEGVKQEKSDKKGLATWSDVKRMKKATPKPAEKPKQTKKGLASWDEVKKMKPLKALKGVRPKIIAKRTPIALEPPLTLPARDTSSHELANSVPVVSGLELSLHEKEEVEKQKKTMKRNREAAVGRPEEASTKTKDLRAKDLGSKDREVLDRRHAVMTGVVSDEKIEPVMSGSRVSAARSKEEELMLQKGTMSEEMIRKAQAASRPAMAQASVTAKSVLPAKGAGTKLTDIQSVRRLVGPVEELGMMSMKEFRRLSSDPKEATRKIADKLDLLQATSYEERIKGVKAWRGSPVNRLYLEMAKEALRSGKAIAEIGAERRNNGKESLSPAEIQAVVALNGLMKF